MAELWGGVVSRTINRAWALAIGFGLWAAIAQAHPGGLDGHGCHHDRKRSGYHCHRAPQHATLAKAPQTLSGRGAFANCTQARAAGAAPLYRGEPGYGRHLDRDNDGVACEPYRKR